MGVDFNAEEIDGLATYAADIPDRRIMAGLHYPLDSVGSWLLAASVMEVSFPPRYLSRALEFTARAIRRSRVFSLLDGPHVDFPHYRAVREYLSSRIPQIDSVDAT
jgi:hypothetical protein